MDKPNIVAKHSKAVKLEPGEYDYCTCGLSKDGVFCDQSHQGTSFKPKRFVVYDPQNVYICLCRHSNNSPHCDGAHRALRGPRTFGEPTEFE